MSVIGKDLLLAVRLPEEDVEIEGVGTVRIRSLSRSEVLEMRGKELTVLDMERRLLTAALIEPKLTEDEVAQWQAASAAGELEPVTEAIMKLSGLNVQAAKETVQRFRS